MPFLVYLPVLWAIYGANAEILGIIFETSREVVACGANTLQDSSNVVLSAPAQIPFALSLSLSVFAESVGSSFSRIFDDAGISNVL